MARAGALDPLPLRHPARGLDPLEPLEDGADEGVLGRDLLEEDLLEALAVGRVHAVEDPGEAVGEVVEDCERVAFVDDELARSRMQL